MRSLLNRSRYFLLAVILAAGLFSILFLEANNQAIREANPGNIEANAASLVDDQTVFSIDNEYYLSPVDNFLDGKGWKRGATVGDGDYVRRVPGYSIVYFVFSRVFGDARFLWLKIFQVFIFLSTIPLIFFLGRQFCSVFACKVITLVYAFTPFFSSWAYFTLTESISPGLTLAYVYFAWSGFNEIDLRKKLLKYVIASLFLISAILTRPYIAISGFILLYFTGWDYLFHKTRNLLRFITAWLIPALLLGAWIYRNYRLTDEIVILEKAYHAESLDRMKPEFRGLFTFTKSWGEDGADFTRYHEPFYWPAVFGDTSSEPIHRIIKSWPSHVVEDMGYDRLYQVLKQHQSVISGYGPYYLQKKAMPDSFTAAQMDAESQYRELIADFKSRNTFEYYVTARLQYLKRAIFHSNTANIYLMQKGEPGIVLLGYKTILYAVNVFLYFALFFNLFFLTGFVKRLVFVFTPLALLFFLCFIHREVEARYMLPLLPLMVIGSGMVIDKLFSLFKKPVYEQA